MNEENNIDTVLSLSKEELKDIFAELSLNDIEDLYETINEVGSDD